MPQQREPAAYRRLKTAWKALVQDLGGVEATAAATRAGRTLASDYGNVASDRYVPVDIILDAEIIAGTPHVTAALAALQGYALVPRQADPAAQIATLLAAVGRESGEVFASAAVALADGKLTSAEALSLVGELADLERAAATAIASLRATAGRGE